MPLLGGHPHEHFTLVQLVVVVVGVNRAQVLEVGVPPLSKVNQSTVKFVDLLQLPSLGPSLCPGLCGGCTTPGTR